MSKVNKGLFVYPWALNEEGIVPTIESYRNDLLTDDLFVAASYHSGRFFHPRLRQKINMRHHSGLSFSPELCLYPEELKPRADDDIHDGQHHHLIRQVCHQNGMTYNSWIVGLHNSSLGRNQPQYCVHNVYGDVYDYILCPNQPVVQEYLKALVLDTCRQLQPDSILLETPGYLGFVHGHHHELILVNLGHVGEYLLSLCFCSECRIIAETKGIDIERLERNVVGKLKGLMENERGALDDHFTQAEIAALFLEDEDLYRYTRMRMETVTDLMRDIKKITRQFKSKLYVVPSAFVTPSSKAWMEGASLSQLSSIVDGYLLLSYFSNPQLVKADVDWMRMWIKDTPLLVGFNVGASKTMSMAGLQNCVSEALTSNLSGISYYNASLLSKTRLEWIGKVNKGLKNG